jgi:membrane protease YdiL (CAAX protease family)
VSDALELWSRLALLTLLAVASLLVLSPPRPPHVALAASVPSAVLAGALVFAALNGRPGVKLARPALAPPVACARVAVFVVLAAGEESIWRRAVLGEGLRVSAGFALVVASLGFALLHRSARPAQVATGAAFGGVYLATGSLLAATCTHVVYNLLVAASADGARSRAAPTPA